MQSHQIIVPQTRHFFTLGKPSSDVRRLWIVCHGYAQLADDFLKNFEILDDGTNLIIAPEGQNVWYRRGFDGQIVANWMTRRHRAEAIENYAEFLQTIYNQYFTQLSADVKVILFGFSQGTATVNRWLLSRRPAFHHLVLWGGLFPEDLDYAAAAHYFSTKKLWLIYGSHDPFLTEERKTAHELLISKNNLDVARAVFEGEHALDSDMLRRLVKAVD
jgi:predicted esterase